MFDPEAVLQSFGPYLLAGLFVIIFFECVFVGVVLGDISGYWIGVKAGPALFNRPKSRL